MAKSPRPSEKTDRSGITRAARRRSGSLRSWLQLASQAQMNGAIERAKAVRLMLFDLDGVLTDGALYLFDSGEELKAFHTRDGQGIKLLAEGGIQTGIITARQSKLVARRAASLGINHVFQGAEDKLAAFEEVSAKLGLEPSACGYVGDDLLDLPILTRTGFAATVPGAPAIVRERVHYVTRAPGGGGAVREICELVLAAQGTLERIQAQYLR